MESTNIVHQVLDDLISYFTQGCSSESAGLFSQDNTCYN